MIPERVLLTGTLRAMHPDVPRRHNTNAVTAAVAAPMARLPGS
jgi:hypothetical protein